MADLKSVTVEYLRKLARKHLGRGHSKLKTKKDLLAALVKRVPVLAKLAGIDEPVQKTEGKGSGERKVPVAVSAASRTETPEDRPKRPAESQKPLSEEEDDDKTPVRPTPRPAEVVTFPPKPKPGRLSHDDEPTLAAPVTTPEPSVVAPAAPPPEPQHVPPAQHVSPEQHVPPVQHVPPAQHAPPAQHTPPAQHAAEPLVEGFFVARVAGEQEAWRHHLTEAQNHRPLETLGSPDYDERLGKLPLDYADDTVLLLPRDPYTLFLLWDFSAAARQRALDGLESPRAVLRIYDDQDILLRVIDVALESRSYYIHGLEPGHPYRVEAHFVGSNGRSRRIGHSSNRVFLPPAGPSSDTSVRFLRMPPVATRGVSMEKVAANAPTRTAPVEEREYITWRRVALPGSGGFEDIAERRRERIDSEAPGEAAPGLEYPHVRRPEGSSEQWAGLRGPGGSSEQWAGLRGPGGSSEQWMASWGPGGSSEQWAEQRRPGGAAEQQWMRSWGPPGGSSEQWAGPGRPGGALEQQWMKSWGPPGGSSEQWAGQGRPGGVSEQWMGSWGPGGSSEQWAGARGPAGSSEQWVWSYGPVDAPEQRTWTRPSPSGQGR